MGLFTGMNITSSALTAQRLRMDVISSNMANAETTRGKYVNGEWQPYQRKTVVLQTKENGFSNYLHTAMNNTKESDVGNGVRVAAIKEDANMVYDPDNPSANEAGYVEKPDYKLIYDPTHADADPKTGYVKMPNVDPLRETVDLISATRSYEANVTVFNASKGMMMKALEIGK
jgi:flagellar basal-body rod protein FlgC